MKIYASLGIHCVALRLFNVYGPGQNLKNLKQGMLSIYLAQALTNNKIVVKGSVDRFRDFVYIDDVVNAFMKGFEYSKGTSFGLFNISTGIPTYVYQLLDTIKLCLENKIEIAVIEGTPGDQFGIFGSNWYAKTTLGWEPKTAFDEGMKAMIAYAKSEI